MQSLEVSVSSAVVHSRSTRIVAPAPPTLFVTSTSIAQFQPFRLQQYIMGGPGDDGTCSKTVPYTRPRCTGVSHPYNQRFERMQLQRTIAVRDDEITRLRGENTAHGSSIQALQKENKKLRKESEQNVAVHAENRFAVSRLETENGELTQKFNETCEMLNAIVLKQYETSQQNDFLEDTNNELSDKLKSEENRVAVLETRFTENDQIIAKLQQENSSIKSICNESSSKVQSLIQKNVELEEEAKKVSIMLNNLKAQSCHTGKVNATLQDQLRIANQTIKNLEASVHKCKNTEDSVAALKRSLSDSEETIEELSKKYEEAMNELQMEKERHTENELQWAATNSQLSAQVEDSSGEIQQLSRSANDKDMKLKELKSAYDKLAGRRKRLFQKSRNLNEQVATLEKQSRGLKDLVALANSTKDQEIVELQEKCANAERTNNETDSHVQTLIQENVELESQNKMFKDKIELQEQELENRRVNAENLETEIEGLKATLMTRSRQLSQLAQEQNVKLENMRGELNLVRNQNQEAQTERKRLLHILTQQRNIMDQQKEEIMARQRVVDKQNGELKLQHQVIQIKNAEIGDKLGQIGALRRELVEQRRAFEAKRANFMEKCMDLVEFSKQI